MRRAALAGLLALISLGLPACTTSGSAGRVQALAVAPQSSRLFQCGPTTLSAVLGFLGKPVAESVISDAIYSPTANGVLLTDLAWYARSQGFQTSVATGTMAALQQAVAAGRPPIVLLDLGLGGVRVPHFTAITGWSGDGVFIQGRAPGGEFVAAGKFQKQWQRAGNQFLALSFSP